MASFPSDWLTLDLQPLLGGNDGFGDNNNNNNSNNNNSNNNNMTNPWFGAFGPETHNNLEVLGKLVNDGVGGFGEDYGMMGGF